MSITQKLVFYKIKILIELFSGIADFLMVIFDIFFYIILGIFYRNKISALPNNNDTKNDNKNIYKPRNK